MRKYIYGPSNYKFASQLAKRVPQTIDFIHQDADKGFVYFIIEKIQGFSRSGIERIRQHSNIYLLFNRRPRTN